MICVGLPAYDEAVAVRVLVPRIFDALGRAGIPSRILLFDDGSTDGTADAAREAAKGAGAEARLSVIGGPPNGGLGRALRGLLAGFLARAGEGEDLVVMDADDTHPPEAIPAMAAKAAEGFDVVIASRYRPGSEVRGVGALRRLGSRLVSRLLARRIGIPGVLDYTCGFRLYRQAALRRAAPSGGPEVLIREPGFAATPELLLRLAAAGARCAEVPFTLRYDRKPGPSKMRPLRELGALTRLR